MNISNDYIYSLYYDRRQKEHLPIQYFLQDLQLQISKYRFAKGYSTWLKREGLRNIEVSEEQYIEWLAGIYKRPLNNCLVIWNQYKDVIKRTGRSPLSNATTVFWIVNQDIEKNKLSRLTGVSTTTIHNHLDSYKQKE